MISPAAAPQSPLVGLPRLGLAVAAAASGAVRGAAALTSMIERSTTRAGERLVLFLPMLILPTVAASSDLFQLLTLFLAVSLIEAVLDAAPTDLAGRIGLVLGAVGWLAVGLGLGAGAALALALFTLVRTIECRVPEALWPIGVVLAALAAALLLDLAMVGLGLERGSVWLALAAAIGAAAAAARHLGQHSAGVGVEPGAPMLDTIAAEAHGRALLEAVLIGALALVLALYAALLAQEPALLQLEQGRQFLALPFLAAALVRLAWLALGPGRTPAADPLAVLLLASWALAVWMLGGG